MGTETIYDLQVFWLHLFPVVVAEILVAIRDEPIAQVRIVNQRANTLGKVGVVFGFEELNCFV